MKYGLAPSGEASAHTFSFAKFVALRDAHQLLEILTMIGELMRRRLPFIEVLNDRQEDSDQILLADLRAIDPRGWLSSWDRAHAASLCSG